MPGSSSRRRQGGANYWPGFVDALAALLVVVVFLVMVFALAQAFLSDALSGRDEALGKLNRQIDELARMLDLERSTNTELRLSVSQLSAQLQSSISERDTLVARLSNAESELESIRAESAEELAVLREQVSADKDTIELQLRDLARLERDIAALRAQMAALNEALEASEALNAEKDVQIVNLGERLNQALATKVQELARYRSKFFGRLREVLGERSDIRIVGDRFVFQSEVLFESGEAVLNPQGETQLAQLAQTLKEISDQIPQDIDWILRVDGHTDERPINTIQFPSNWELSSARAISVVKFLIRQGISPENLVAAGFGEYQPIDPGRDEIAYLRNRRIEFKLDQR